MYVLLAVKEVVVDHKFRYANKVRVFNKSSFYDGCFGTIVDYIREFDSLTEEYTNRLSYQVRLDFQDTIIIVSEEHLGMVG